MGDASDICPHLDSIGEVTRDDLLLKSKVQHVLLVSPFPFSYHAWVCCPSLWRRGRNSSPVLVYPPLSHKAFVDPPGSVSSLSFYPAQICHLAKMPQRVSWGIKQ